MNKGIWSGQNGRLLELDGVRGLAALLVLYSHLFLMWVPAPNPIAFWARTMTGVSWTGVYLFFVLSGFLIGGILLRNREATNFFQVFYLRRAFRILPLYYALIVAVIVIRPWLPGEQGAEFASEAVPLWTYLAMVQNVPMAMTGEWGIGVLGISWSVAVEEQFYLLLPLLIWIVPERWHLPLFAAVALSGPLFRYLAPVAHAPFLLNGSIEALFGGVLLAWAYKHHPQMFHRTRWIMFVSGIFVVCGVGMALMSVGIGFGALQVTLITLFWGTFLWMVLMLMGTPWTALLRGRPLRVVGTLSYGIYLFHQLVNNLVFFALTGAGPTHELGSKGAAIALLSSLIVLALAACSFYLVENRLIRFAGRFPYRHARNALLAPQDAVREPEGRAAIN